MRDRLQDIIIEKSEKAEIKGSYKFGNQNHGRKKFLMCGCGAHRYDGECAYDAPGCSNDCDCDEHTHTCSYECTMEGD